MTRIVDILSVLILGLAGVAFVWGMLALGALQHLAALYWLAVGGLLLKAGVELLRPGAGS